MRFLDPECGYGTGLPSGRRIVKADRVYPTSGCAERFRITRPRRGTGPPWSIRTADAQSGKGRGSLARAGRRAAACSGPCGRRTSNVLDGRQTESRSPGSATAGCTCICSIRTTARHDCSRRVNSKWKMLALARAERRWSFLRIKAMPSDGILARLTRKRSGSPQRLTSWANGIEFSPAVLNNGGVVGCCTWMRKLPARAALCLDGAGTLR